MQRPIMSHQVPLVQGSCLSSLRSRKTKNPKGPPKRILFFSLKMIVYCMQVLLMNLEETFTAYQRELLSLIAFLGTTAPEIPTQGQQDLVTLGIIVQMVQLLVYSLNQREVTTQSKDRPLPPPVPLERTKSLTERSSVIHVSRQLIVTRKAWPYRKPVRAGFIAHRVVSSRQHVPEGHTIRIKAKQTYLNVYSAHLGITVARKD